MAIASASTLVRATKSTACAGVGQQLVVAELALGAMAVFLLALAGLERAEHAELALDRSADPMGEIDDAARDARHCSRSSAGVLPSALSEPSIITEVKPKRMALAQVASLLPWS